MGRKKSVPGPLTLTQTVPEPRHPPNASSHTHSVKSSASIPTQTQHRLQVGETDKTDQARLSPPGLAPSINSLSPKSPRSPYISKFSPKHANTSQSRLQQTPSPSLSPSPSPSQYQSQQAIPRKPTTQPQETIPPAHPQHQHQHQHLHQHHQQQQQQQQPNSQRSPAAHETKQPHIAELQQRFPPISRAATSSPRQQSQHHSHSDRRLKSSHGRRHEDKSTSSSNNNQSNNNIKQGFFFNFHKPAKSSDRLPTPTQGLQTAQSAREAMNGTDQPPVTKQSSKQSDTSYAPAPSLPSKSETSLADGDPNSTPTSTKKASKPKPFTLLSRTKSHREKDGRNPRHTPSPQEARERAITPQLPSSMEPERPERAHVAQAPKTATVPHEHAYREAMTSASRNHSADRAHSRDASSDRRGHQDREYARSHQSTPRDGNGASSFFNNLRREGGRVAESIGKGLFGKSGRSASTTERDPVDDEHYVLKVINRPLIEQARLTRISKRLEESRDKTEFWMPAFPWRAIDYLNYKGCDVEGLYRVPGSGPQIKKWQRRFDEQYDVDLFTQEDLYDINIIGSMLKAWLRELPDELFPKEAQDRIARECAGAEKVPQMLIDELSNLSPFNYYLLFAITCHLSLLLAHSDKNKMDFRNLCICFQPCMKIDAFCFKFLVCDWRDCWKGCKTEAKYIEEEYKLFDQPPPPGLGVRKRLEPRVESRLDRRPSPTPDREERERNISSSDSNSKRSQHVGDQSRLKKKMAPHENGKENGSAVAKSAHTENPDAPGSSPRGSGDMRPLSPIKPLSPLGF